MERNLIKINYLRNKLIDFLIQENKNPQCLGLPKLTTLAESSPQIQLFAHIFNFSI